MSRVRDSGKRDAERIAQEKRQDKANQKSAREEGGKFSKMMEGKKAPPKESQLPGKAGPRSAESQSPKQPSQAKKSPSSPTTEAGKSNQAAAAMEGSGQKQTAQNTLLARQGIANNRFSDTLAQTGHQNVSRSTSDATTQSKEVAEGKEHFNEEEAQITREAQGGQQRLEAISRDDQPRGGMGGNEPGDEDIEQLSDPTLASSAPGAAPLQSSQPTPSAPRLPDAMIQEMVKRVLVGTNTEGDSQFHIEFKDDVLGGVRLEVSTSNGKINAKFITDDVNISRLLKASEGQLSRAFGHKGLNLARLEVESP